MARRVEQVEGEPPCSKLIAADETEMPRSRSTAIQSERTRRRNLSISSGRRVIPKILPSNRRQLLEEDVRHFLLFADEALAHLLKLAHAQFFGGAEHRRVSPDLELLPAMGGNAVFRHNARQQRFQATASRIAMSLSVDVSDPSAFSCCSISSVWRRETSRWCCMCVFSCGYLSARAMSRSRLSVVAASIACASRNHAIKLSFLLLAIAPTILRVAVLMSAAFLVTESAAPAITAREDRLLATISHAIPIPIRTSGSGCSRTSRAKLRPKPAPGPSRA